MLNLDPWSSPAIIGEWQRESGQGHPNNVLNAWLILWLHYHRHSSTVSGGSPPPPSNIICPCCNAAPTSLWIVMPPHYLANPRNASGGSTWSGINTSLYQTESVQTQPKHLAVYSSWWTSLDISYSFTIPGWKWLLTWQINDQLCERTQEIPFIKKHSGVNKNSDVIMLSSRFNTGNAWKQKANPYVSMMLPCTYMNKYDKHYTVVPIVLTLLDSIVSRYLCDSTCWHDIATVDISVTAHSLYDMTLQQ